MDVVEIEQKLTEWVASVLKISVDKGLYRGGIPTGELGIAVILGADIPNEVQFRPRTYNLQIIGKLANRDSASRMLAKLSGSLPLREFTFNGMKFKSISQRGEGEPYAVEDNGTVVYYASFNALVVVLTSGAQL